MIKKFYFIYSVGIMIVASLLTAIVYQAYAADPPSLKVSVKAEEDPIMRGNEQTISVTVADTAGNPVAGASVMSHMITPSESTPKNFNGKTDENGKWSFSWQIDNQSKAGLVGVEVKASKTGFDDSYGSTFFKVIG